MAIPLIYLNLATAEKLDEVYKTSMLLGFVFQVRDDFLDVYGDPLITGKIGTNIQKTNAPGFQSIFWNIEHCNDEQKKEFERCYGSANEDDVLNVKELFRDLNPFKAFQDLDKEMATKIEAAFEGTADAASKEVLIAFLSKYNRDPRRSLAQPA